MSVSTNTFSLVFVSFDTNPNSLKNGQLLATDREDLSNFFQPMSAKTSTAEIPLNDHLFTQSNTPTVEKIPDTIGNDNLPTPSLSPAPENSSDTIRVERFEFVGNTAFSNQELAAAVAEFIGKPLSFAQLLEAEQAITRLYVQAGYINSGAVIEAGQTLSPEGSVVKITIIEGGLEDIEVTGTQRLKPDYIRSRLAVATQKPFNQNRLLQALQVLQLNPLIETISAELSAGARPELSLLKVKVTEADSFSLSPFADNGRNPTLGSFQRGVNIAEGNLLGFGDRIEVNYGNTDGSDVIDLNYTIPVNPYNGTIRLAAGYSNNAVIEQLFNVLNITGEYLYYEVSFRQPLFQSPTEEFALGVTLSRQESQNFLLGEGFPLSLGANDNGQIRISAIRFFQDWLTRSSQDVLAVHSQFSLGLNILDATINSQGLPDSRFFVWRGQGQYVRLLAPDTLLVVRSDLQLANEPLFALEQFSLGGLGSVRGYPQDFLLTDNGFFASVEVRLPIARFPEIQGVLQIVPFLDLGVGWNNGIFPDPNPNTLVGTGLGLQWQMGNRLSARFDWGIPLIPIPADIQRNSWNANGIYFSINYSLF